jgi:hypothetical protein
MPGTFPSGLSSRSNARTSPSSRVASLVGGVYALGTALLTPIGDLLSGRLRSAAELLGHRLRGLLWDEGGAFAVVRRIVGAWCRLRYDGGGLHAALTRLADGLADPAAGLLHA